MTIANTATPIRKVLIPRITVQNNRSFLLSNFIFSAYRSLPAVVNNNGRFHLISMVQIYRESHGNSSKKYCSIKYGPVPTIGLCEDQSSAPMAKGTELGTPIV